MATLGTGGAGAVTPAIPRVQLLYPVHQIESHLLQPILMGHAVELHPLAGIVVVTAPVNTVVRYLVARDDRPGEGILLERDEEAASPSGLVDHSRGTR